jgi:PAS domain S-box-containing protein
VFRALVENSPDLIFRYRLLPSPGFEYVSPAATHLLGYTPEEHYADPLFGRRLVHPDDLALFKESMAALGRGEELPGALVLRFVHRNGKILWLEQHLVYERDESGRLIAFGGIARDVTDRRKLESALRDSDRHFRKLIENATDLVATLDATGIITYQSPAVRRVLGFEPEELVGQSAFDFLHPDEREQVQRTFFASLGRQELQTLEYRYRRKNGTYCWLESCGRPLFDEAGVVIGGIINSRDVTERREVSDALVRSNAIRKAIEDAVMAGLVVCDAKGRLTYANPAFTRMTDYYEEELVGTTPPFPYWAPEDLEARLVRFQRMLRGEAPPIPYETRLVKRNGDRFDAFLQPSPIQLPDGTQGWIAVVTDTTERKQLENQFQQALKMEAIGRLAGGVAHDFNNLLTAILGYAELALDEALPGNPLRESLVEIRKAGESAASLTRQLLAFSRHQVLQPTVLDLNTVVTEMTKILGRVIGEDVRLVTALAADLRSTRADRGQIEQVIMNLAVNARDAMPSGGQLVIQTGNRTLAEPAAAGLTDLAPGEYVVLGVSDTGHGMDDGVLEHLFEPFFTTKERGRGTGLGLATIYGIVKQSGGHINVRTQPGKGTSFVVLLPACDAAEAQAGAGTRQQAWRVAAERILVVEDNDAIRSLAQQVLAQAGYSVHVASTSEDALAMLATGGLGVDLLLTDVVMPGMSGSALAVQLRQRYPRLPCIFMSGYTDDALKYHGVEQMEDVFLPKPFRPATLLQKVRERLDHPAGA